MIDVFQRIKLLHELGYGIILHAFDYNGRATETNINALKEFCETIYIYKRNNNPFLLFSKLPYIVISRRSEILKNRLSENKYPILFEGKHTTAFIDHPALKDRMKVVRTHNIEAEYYAELKKVTRNPFKRIFFKIESKKLKKYENKIISFADKILAISEADSQHFSKTNSNTQLLLPTIADTLNQVEQPFESFSKFILFHGNLSVDENEHAALYLIKHVFSKIDFPVVIAGKMPSKRLIKKANAFPNINIESSPNEKRMQELIHTAHIHVLYSFQQTGIKLKLLNVLQNGKFCIANENVIGQMQVNDILIHTNNPEEITENINKLMPKDFDSELTQNRRTFLNQMRNESINVLASAFKDVQ